jgi:hypothetical protein
MMDRRRWQQLRSTEAEPVGVSMGETVETVEA